LDGLLLPWSLSYILFMHKCSDNSLAKISILLLCTWLASCGGYKGPAPIRNLSLEPNSQEVAKSGRYTVRNTDTLYSIAFRFGLDFQFLASINKIDKPYTIHPGQTLLLRKKYLAKTRTRTRSSRAKTLANSPTGKSVTKIAPESIVAMQQSNSKGKQKVNSKHKGKQLNTAFDSKKKVTTWLWPVKNKESKKVISGKGEQQGIDIRGTLGEPVRATAAGRVVYSGNGLVGYGNLIIIKHSQSYLSAYAHNDKILVKEKSIVKAGQKIATMGKSSTGQVQLHFEIRYQGKPVNPMKFLGASG